MPFSPHWKKKLLSWSRRNIIAKGGRPRANTQYLRRVASTGRKMPSPKLRLVHKGMFGKTPYRIPKRDGNGGWVGWADRW